MAEETTATNNGQVDNSTTTSTTDADDSNDTAGEGLVKTSTERVIMEFKVSVPKGFELLKHRTAFGRRGEKGKIKNDKGEMVKKLWLADVQFTDIEQIIENALANVNVPLRRVVDMGLWPEEGIPLVNAEGKFVSPPKTLEEMVAEINSEDELDKLEAFIKAQRELYRAKMRTQQITVNNPEVVSVTPEVDPTTGLTMEQLEQATNPENNSQETPPKDEPKPVAQVKRTTRKN